MFVVCNETPAKYLDEIRKQKVQNSKNHFGIPTLCSAIYKFRSTYLVEELLKDGASVDEFTCMKTSSPLRFNKIEEDRFRLWGEYSAIHLAVSLGQYEILSLLLDNGADLSSKTTKGVKLLDFILNPHLRCILDEIVESNVFEKDDLEMLKIMKKNGVDLNKKERISETTVLHRAIIYDSREIVRYLISAGVDVNCVDKRSCTTLHYCTCNNVESGRILLESDVNPNAQNKFGNTICHHIFRPTGICGGKVETKTLIDFVDLLHKRNVNPNIQNDHAETALHICLNMPYKQNEGLLGQFELVDSLLRLGADPNIKDIFERTPVYYLVMNLRRDNFNTFESIWVLLTKLFHFGAELDHVDITGTPLLHVLVNRLLLYRIDRFRGVPCCIEIAKFWNEILQTKYKVDLNVQDYYNRTVFHLVSAMGDWNLGEVFLKHGGNLDIVDCDGNTPLDVALMCKQWKFARNLLIWPFIVGKSRDFRRNSALSRGDEDTTNYSTSKAKVICTSLLFRSLTLANYNINSINSNNSSSCSSNNNSNSSSRDNNSSNNNSNNNSSSNNNNSSNKINNNSLHFDNQNRIDMNKLTQVKRRNSMPSIKSRKQDDTAVTPLGASVKWTKDKLDTVATVLANDGNQFYPTIEKCDPLFSEVQSLCPIPQITEEFLPHLSKSSLQRLCEESSLEFHLTETCGEEHCLVFKQVFSLVQDLLNKCSEMDPRLKSKLHWAGSSSEGTKMWLPDEFDFLMELVELQGCCYMNGSLR